MTYHDIVRGKSLPKSREEMIDWSPAQLMDLAGLCDVEPAEEHECLACWAYLEAQRRETPVLTFKQAGDLGAMIVKAKDRAAELGLEEIVRGLAVTLRRIDTIYRTAADNESPGGGT